LKVGSENFGLLAPVHLVCGAAPVSGLLDRVERGALRKVFPLPANTGRVAKGDGDSGLAASGLVQDLRGLDRWRGLASGLVWIAVDEDMVSGTWTFDAQMKL
jgi:hypothetical protein